MYFVISQLDFLSLLDDNQVEWVGHFDPALKFLASQFQTKERLLAVELEGAIKRAQFSKKDFKLPLDPTVSKYDKDWQASFTDESGNTYITLRVVLEEKTRSLNSLQSYMSQLKKVSLGSVLEFKQTGAKRFIVHVRKEDASAVAYELARRSEVFWVEVAAKNELHNLWAKGITQSGAVGVEPISYRGINGRNQIVTVGDSGLDPNSCFFYDPDHETPYVNSTEEATVSAHRKIASYWRMIDDVAEDDAHGTHVSGSIASQSVASSLSAHDGIAKDSKVAFVDVGCSTPGGCTCSGVDSGCGCDYYYRSTCPASTRAVYIPDSLSENYFPFAYKLGSRIHSNSWGGGDGILGYSIDTADIDKYIWENKDFLVLFSAGNSGDEIGYSSISAQAESKNGIAVGASMNPRDTFQFVTEKVLDMDTYAANYGAILSSMFGCSDINVNGSSAQCLQYDPELIALCKFIKDFDTEEDCCSKASYCNSTTSCGCGFYGLGDLCCRTCRATKLKNSIYASTIYNSENIAYFSSRGPTSDGRIKPDIVAPGYTIVSARSHNTLSSSKTCSEVSDNEQQSLLNMAGTSMSCPITSANAALVRQYYTEGWYYNGKNNTEKGFNPSAALVKATLINSGVPLKGYLDYSGFMLPINPTEEQEFYLQAKYLEGFGRIQLDRVMMFDNSTRKLLVARKENLKTSSGVDTEFGDPMIDSTDDSHIYCLDSAASGSMEDVKITLVWTDYPSTPSSKKHLVNDLDLGVRIDEDVYFGNSDKKNTFQRDHVNNVEQVTISKTSSRIVINVASPYIYKAQSYALLISGTNIKFDRCTTGDTFDYSSIGKTYGTSLGTGIRIFGFDLALVMVAVLIILLVIAVASITACIFAIFIYNKARKTNDSFQTLEDETNRELNETN